MKTKDEGPFPPNSVNMRYDKVGIVVGVPLCYLYRCTCCGFNYPESAFLNTPHGDYCGQCVNAGLHTIEAPDEIVKLKRYVIYE